MAISRTTAASPIATTPRAVLSNRAAEAALSHKHDATYAYDAQGRRKSKTVGSTTTIYVTDADNREVLEYNGSSGAIGNWYSFAPANAFGPDAVLNQMNVASGTRGTFIPDIQGSIIGSLDATSGALTKIGYQTYGENPSLTTGSYRYTARASIPRPPAARRNPPASTTTAPACTRRRGDGFSRSIRLGMRVGVISIPMSGMIRSTIQIPMGFGLFRLAWLGLQAELYLAVSNTALHLELGGSPHTLRSLAALVPARGRKLR